MILLSDEVRLSSNHYFFNSMCDLEYIYIDIASWWYHILWTLWRMFKKGGQIRLWIQIGVLCVEGERILITYFCTAILREAYGLGYSNLEVNYWSLRKKIDDFVNTFYHGLGYKGDLKSLWRRGSCAILSIWLERNRRTFCDRILPLDIIWYKAKF